jgi:hypothetical protein
LSQHTAELTLRSLIYSLEREPWCRDSHGGSDFASEDLLSLRGARIPCSVKKKIHCEVILRQAFEFANLLGARVVSQNLENSPVRRELTRETGSPLTVSVGSPGVRLARPSLRLAVAEAFDCR